MKKWFTLMIVFGLFSFSCAPQKPASTSEKDKVAEIKPEKNDEGEWDLDVMDSQWDYYLNAVAKPMSMYTESYLKNKNVFLVSEWNSYYYSGRYRDIVESSIEYNPQENYGLKFEYKLYQVFAFVSWKYGLLMNGLSAADAYH